MKAHQDICMTLILAFCLLLVPATGSAQNVVGVLSSDLKPYAEAFEGLQEATGRTVPRITLSDAPPKIGRETRVVVAFGGKAALAQYPSHVRIIYCLAPGIQSNLQLEDRRFTRIYMLPLPGFVIQKLRSLQPGLKRLAIFWTLKTMADYRERLAQAAESFGIEVLNEQVERSEHLPERLRDSLHQKADALWMAPDPVLINAHNFSVIKEFCRANSIAFYVPTARLVEKGAVASVSSSFREIGRTAGRVAENILNGTQKAQVVYTNQIETTVNLKAAAQAGIQIDRSALSQEDRVLP